MKRDINAYSDGEVFKPGERWQSPRGSFYYVLGAKVGGRATLRTLGSPSANLVPIGGERLGKLRMVPWDGVDGWVCIARPSNKNMENYS